MNFADKLFLRFADERLRAGIFDAPALEYLARAAYDADALGITGPYGVAFDDVWLGLPLTGGGRVDAICRGTISAHALVAEDVVSIVDAAWDRPEHGRLTLAFPEAASSAVPVRLPVVIGVKVRDKGFSVADLVAESRADRDRVESLGFSEPGVPRRKHDAVIAWLVPETVFADADWPGGDGLQEPADQVVARRARSAPWLADAGIAVAVVAVPK
jgi:hypothetical protein